MNAESPTPSTTELVGELSNWNVGAGILTTALFPLALPIFILTVIALIPVLVPVLAVGLLIGIVALPILLVRGLAKWVIRTLRPQRPAVLRG
jgi:hypothetical protein